MGFIRYLNDLTQVVYLGILGRYYQEDYLELLGYVLLQVMLFQNIQDGKGGMIYILELSIWTNDSSRYIGRYLPLLIYILFLADLHTRDLVLEIAYTDC